MLSNFLPTETWILGAGRFAAGFAQCGASRSSSSAAAGTVPFKRTELGAGETLTAELSDEIADVSVRACWRGAVDAPFAGELGTRFETSS